MAGTNRRYVSHFEGQKITTSTQENNADKYLEILLQPELETQEVEESTITRSAGCDTALVMARHVRYCSFHRTYCSQDYDIFRSATKKNRCECFHSGRAFFCGLERNK